MKTRALTRLACVALGVLSLSSAYGQPNDSDTRYQRGDREEERYVFVTGSLIPKKVKIRSGRPDTADNVRIYDEHDIRSSGRATTGEALRTLDPDISLRRH